MTAGLKLTWKKCAHWRALPDVTGQSLAGFFQAGARFYMCNVYMSIARENYVRWLEGATDLSERLETFLN
jgi:hypothetical protein